MSTSMTTTTLSNYINGEFVPAVDGTLLDNLNPATSQLLSRIPRSKAADVDAAARAAKAAFPAWSALSHVERAAYLDKIAVAIEQQLERFAELESTDAGKSLQQARTVDIPRAISNFRFFAGAVRHDATEAHWTVDSFNVTQRTPVGVAGLITPWNLPIYLLSWKVAPALAMGNTVVCKPSELTPMTANALAEAIHSVGLPRGVFNIVHGLGPEAGQALLEHADVELISFTGGTVTGRRVASTCAPLFKKLSLELGGKNATVVFADCDFERTVRETVRASFLNAGQVCLAGSRLLIQDTIYDRFLDAFVTEARRMTVGEPSKSSIGSLTSLQHREKIESYVELARQDGGKILCGGERPKLEPPFDAGAFYLPTVIAGLPPTHRCSVEEIFGPVVTVHSFSTDDEALAIVNNTKYGLAGSLWTTNVGRAQRLTRAWQTGMVWVNCWLHRDLRVPFGGVKESGLGTEGGRHSLEAYSNFKNICFHIAS